ncbi:YoaK family protein [Paenarthrobacter sp. PH39-S1]|uniref:YoaK family protein n=1 Tax=Micrococcaceae TaxID=1268 RepID=UPI0024BA83B3|nr:YoaK family protein [Paenarthrobacter sp. PH39-S1]MDJ0354752.1 YoaK family protein [Paenarthrobacter sp. PH39-S1]
MHRHHRTEIVLAVGLSAVAGFVDAIGFIHLGGYFVSFMSGNSTRAGALLADGSWLGVALAMGLVAAFLTGVIAGSLLRRTVPVHKRIVVLLCIAAMLAAAAVLFDAGFWVSLVPPMMAFAMGAENVVFERDGEVSIGLTYMTGTLVKMGQRIAGALAGGERLGWLRYFLLWFALTCGSIMGGLAYHALSLDALWLAVAGILTATLISRRVPVHE